MLQFRVVDRIHYRLRSMGSEGRSGVIFISKFWIQLAAFKQHRDSVNGGQEIHGRLPRKNYFALVAYVALCICAINYAAEQTFAVHHRLACPLSANPKVQFIETSHAKFLVAAIAVVILLTRCTELASCQLLSRPRSHVFGTSCTILFYCYDPVAHVKVGFKSSDFVASRTVLLLSYPGVCYQRLDCNQRFFHTLTASQIPVAIAQGVEAKNIFSFINYSGSRSSYKNVRNE